MRRSERRPSDRRRRRRSPHPRETTELFGHAEAEQTLLDAYRGGRIPHAWLIGGEAGIGKATLAYRMARFVLAHPDPAAPAVQKAKSLAVAADHPVARRIAGQAHSDLLVLERVVNEKTGKLFTEIRVDDVRRTRVVLRLDRGRGRLARRDRRSAGGPEPRRRERAAQGAGRAAAARAAAAGQPRAGPRAADHPLALPPPDPAPARRPRTSRAPPPRRWARAPTPTTSAPPPPRPTARSAAR